MSSEIEQWLTEFNSLAKTEDTVEYVDDKKKHKLDLFKQVLPALDRRDYGFYGRCTKDEQSSLSPWLLMRWMSAPASSSDMPHYLLSVNDLVNNNFSCMSPRKTLNLQGHEELQWMLLCLCGTNRNVRRKFISPPKGVIKNKLEAQLSEFFPNLRTYEFDLLMSLNTVDDIKEFLKENGIDDFKD